eukprot:scaffold28621_cov144-Amphora_coffeaeformis.AAC.1
MSSYFHSAAMTLLSKTLQTLLYKYLSDVDVEGVALPSLYNTDGHSGWGVRLSNVKLREGVKLMDLPGRIPKENNEDTTTAATTEGGEGASEQATTQQNTDSSDYQTPRKAGSDSLPSTSHSVTTLGMESSHHRTPMAGTQTNNGLDTVVDDDDERNHPQEDSNEEELVERPPLPKRSSSWFSWGGRRSKSDGASPVTASEAAATRVGVERTRSGTEEMSSPLHALSVTEHVSSSEPPRSGNYESRLASLDDTDHSIHSSVSFEEYHHHGSNPHRSSRSRNRPSSKTEKEPPMRLRLGKNGQIGILDVRLVGKDLHVVVEDADLTIEAVIVKPSSDHDKEENGKDKAPK